MTTRSGASDCSIATPSGGVDALGLEDGHAVLLGDGLHAAAGLARGAALLPGVAVGLGEQADDQSGPAEQGLEGRLGEGAGAQHHDAHRRACRGGDVSGGPLSPARPGYFSISASGGISPFFWAFL